MDTNEWYEKWRRRVKEEANKLPKTPSNVSQITLHHKAYIIERIEQDKKDDEKVCTFKHEDKYGFSEHYVNYIIEHAYNMGKAQGSIDLKRSIDYYEKMFNDIREIVGED